MARSKKTSDKTTGKTDGKAAEEIAPETAPEDKVEDAVVISETPPEEPDGGTEPAPDADGEHLPEIADYVESGDEGSEPVRPDEEAAGTDSPADDADTPSAQTVTDDTVEGDDAGTSVESDETVTPDDDTPADAENEPETVEGETFVMTEGESSPADEETGKETDDEAHVPATTVATESIPKRSSPVPVFAAMVLGGAVAAGIGFFVAMSMTPEAPVESPGPDAETVAILTEQTQRLDALESGAADAITIDAVEQAVSPFAETVAGVDSRIADLETTLADVNDRLDALSDRVETIAMRPESTGIDPGEFDQAITEFRQQLESAIRNAQVEIDAARQEAERISEEAFNSEQSAIARAAWREVLTALESGAAYEAPLAEVGPMLDGPVPEVLSANAADGLPTLAELQADFPEAARSAIAAETREEVDGGTVDRITSFFKVQTGFRSLEPREGDDADAVLSRAEAALRSGDLETALAEVETLDGPAAAAMNEWAETAQARVSGLDAAADISARLLE